jgi:hypothetical protein
LKSRFHSHLFAIVLCIFALIVAQTLSGQGRYVCVCGGKPLVTQIAHCYGPHGEQCHTGDGKADGSQSEEDSGSREEHQVVKHDVQSRPGTAAPQVIAPQVLLAILPAGEVLFASRETKVPARYSGDWGESPPFGVTVARTIVLLI